MPVTLLIGNDILMPNRVSIDSAMKKIYNDILDRCSRNQEDGDPPLTTRETFRVDLDTKLMYQMSPDGRERLYVPVSLHKEILEVAHDSYAHQERLGTTERVRQSMYIPHLRRLVEQYIQSCLVCKACRPSGGKPPGELQPISPPFIPFHTITIDFITGLPSTPNEYDCVLTLTNKATKYVKLMPGQIDEDAFYWAIKVFDYVVCEWGLPKVIISDRDSRFMSKF